MKRSLLLITGGALALSLAVPAAAHDKSYKTRVTIEHPSDPVYEGDVSSHFDGCVRRRRVQLWFDNTAGPDSLIDEIKANREGHWRVEFVGSNYYAKVNRNVKTPGQHRHICKGDRSPTV